MQKQLMELFTQMYGEGGDIRGYFAPGRVNLIGEHTDYNGGHVFPCALTLGTYGLARKREDNILRFYSANFPKAGMIQSSLEELVPSEEAGWTNYPKGVMWTFEKRGYKLTCGLDFMIFGNIPNGSGLSSSASLEVLTGTMLKDLFGFDEISMQDIAIMGQYSENNFNGMNCGIMDQFASAMGKKGCETALEDLQKVMDIKTLGDLTEAEFEAHKDAIQDPVCVKRAKHAVYENQRTIKAVQALKENNIKEFGKLMNASHVSLRDDFEVSCEEIDILVDLAWKTPGVIGSRITGGGFGGCTVSIVENDQVQAFTENIGKAYAEKVGHEAEFYVVDMGDGAGKMDIKDMNVQVEC